MGLIDQINKQNNKNEEKPVQHDFDEIKSIYDKSYKYSFALCLRISSDITYSKSLVNKIYANAYFELPKLRPSVNKSNWIIDIAIQTIIAEYKKGRLSISDSSNGTISAKNVMFNKQQYKLEKNLSELRTEERLLYILLEIVKIPSAYTSKLIGKDEEEINTIVTYTKKSLIATGVTDFVSEYDENIHLNNLAQLTLSLPLSIEPDTDLWESSLKRIKKKLRNFDETKENYELPITERKDDDEIKKSFGFISFNTKTIIYFFLFVLIIIGGYHTYNFIFSDREPWTLSAFENVKINGQNLKGNLKLGINDKLENGNEETKVNIPHFGNLIVYPNSIIERKSPGETELSVRLLRGKLNYNSFQGIKFISLKVLNSDIINYYIGSEAEIEIINENFATVKVKAGAMEIRIKNNFIIVPAEYIGTGISNNKLLLPYSIEAGADYVENIIAFNEDNQNLNVINIIVNSSQKRDSYTLWNLLLLSRNETREKVFAQLESFVPLPRNVTKDKILKLDRQSLLLWFDKIEDIYYE